MRCHPIAIHQIAFLRGGRGHIFFLPLFLFEIYFKNCFGYSNRCEVKQAVQYPCAVLSNTAIVCNCLGVRRTSTLSVRRPNLNFNRKVS